MLLIAIFSVLWPCSLVCADVSEHIVSFRVYYMIILEDPAAFIIRTDHQG